MLNAISWGDFLTIIIILLIIYYAAIGMLYFRKDIPQIIIRLTGAKNDNNENDSSTKNEENN